MDRTIVNTTRLLTWSGLIPFAGLALVAMLPSPDWLDLLLTGYAALILAFLAGTLWARHLPGDQVPGDHAHPRRLIASNVLVLAAWPALLMPIAWAALWLAVLFAAHLMLEEPWRAYGMPSWYRRLRLAVSLAAIALLLTGGLIGAGFGE